MATSMMQETAVGLYCAVVDRINLWVSTRTIAVRETRAAYNRLAGWLCDGWVH
jgi:hypothetical protein